MVIYGTGGLGRDIMGSLEQQNKTTNEYHIMGFIDDAMDQIGSMVNGYPIIGTGEYLDDYETPICVLICIANPAIRKALVKRLKKNKNIEFPNFIASDVHVNNQLVHLGTGNIIASHCIVTVNIEIGDFNIINIQSTIEHDMIIKDYSTIAPGCNISGNVTIESGCDIGTATAMKQGITIGANTVIGMGSVVVKSIPSGVVAYGNPCKVRE